MLQNIRTYMMTECEDYRVVIAYGPQHSEHLVAWEGKTSREFNETIGSLGNFAYRTEEYCVGPRRFVEHIWERMEEHDAKKNTLNVSDCAKS